MPPCQVLDDMYHTLGQAAEICERFHLEPRDISDEVSTLVTYSQGCKAIQICNPGVPFPFINVGKWKLNKIKKRGKHADAID